MLLSANTGGATETMSGACAIFCWIAVRAWLCAGDGGVAVGEGHQHLHRAQRAGSQRLGRRGHPGANLV